MISSTEQTAAAPTPPIPTQKMAYRRKEAARQLSISVRQLDYQIDAGVIPVMRVGKSILITHQALQQFLRRGYVPGRS
jgi:excisionase family DNA binding protein